MDFYNKDGFNVEGFTALGYNREGYNRYGFNRDGHNRQGFNREGRFVPPENRGESIAQRTRRESATPAAMVGVRRGSRNTYMPYQPQVLPGDREGPYGEWFRQAADGGWYRLRDGMPGIIRGVPLEIGDRQDADGDWFRQADDGFWYSINDGGFSYYSIWPGE